MQGKVEICGVNTAKLKTLKNDEMVELLRRSKQGDEQARQRLVEGNLRLVLSVIQKFIGRGENPDDLFQVGCIGLLKAIQNFDETKLVRFSISLSMPFWINTSVRVSTLLVASSRIRIFGSARKARAMVSSCFCP